MSNEYDSSLLNYQKGRQIAMDGQADRVAEIAKERNLPPSMRRLLESVILDWGERKEQFFQVCQDVWADEGAPSMARALAAEHAASYCSVTGDLEGVQLWSDRALAFELEGVDVKLLRYKVEEGLRDAGLLDESIEGRMEALDYMIEVGAYDVPKRALNLIAMVERVYLEQVAALDLDETTANKFFVGKCVARLAELKGK